MIDPNRSDEAEYRSDGSDGLVPNRSRRRANLLAVLAATVLGSTGLYLKFSDDARRHLFGWTLIIHHDHSVAVWSPWNNLLAMDLSGFGTATGLLAFGYLLWWVTETVVARIAPRKPGGPGPGEGFPMD